MSRALILLALLCAGCGNSERSGDGSNPLVYHDKLTGCDYLIRGDSMYDSLMPRMGADGKQICGKGK